MMTNLFSIFDPSTQSFSHMNWISILMSFLFIPFFIWLISSRYKITLINLFNYLYGEFKPLLRTSSFLIIMMMSLFFIISMSNFPGLFPFIFTPSSHVSFTLSFALPLWLGIYMFSWINNMSNTLVHLIPQSTPTILMPFMVMIETVSSLIRPFTLAVRLAANMIAGHLLISLLSMATPLSPILMSPLLGMAQMALASLEVAVAFIQAYVFSVLMTLYVSESIN